MVSDVGAAGEGWPWVDSIDASETCDPRLALPKPASSTSGKGEGNTKTNAKWARPRLPTMLHYCQRYEVPELQPDTLTEALSKTNNKQVGSRV